MIWCVEAAPSIREQETYVLNNTGSEAWGFERFCRVDKRQPGGTGLGLSIVKHAVQQHSARLNPQSTPGVGTAITVTF